MGYFVEQTAGGSNVTVSITWSEADELSGFDRTNWSIAQFENCNWKGFGAGPATINANGIFTQNGY